MGSVRTNVRTPPGPGLAVWSGRSAGPRRTRPLPRPGGSTYCWSNELLVSPTCWSSITEGARMRRVGDLIEPLTGGAGEIGQREQPPLAFRWRGRRYVVGSVLAHWVETGAWWRTPAVATAAAATAGPATAGPATAGPMTTAPDVVADPERQLWRVEVCRGKSTGVFDLCHDTTGWSLRGVHD